MNTLSEARLQCRVLACSRPVFLEHRCKLHYDRLCERADVETREADKATAPVKERAFRLCEVRDCGRRVVGQGLCQQHLLRWKRRQPLTPIRQWGQTQTLP